MPDDAVSTPSGSHPTSAPRDVLGLVGSTPGEPAFDGHHPPGLDLVDDCVHCGFCLPTCPTYVLWGEEMDSPRGRVYLMKQGLDGEPMTDSMVEHFDRCLGCMACVTACPSGVQYDKLISDTRQQVERRHPRSPRDRALREAIFTLFPYPKRLRLLRGPLRAYQASGLQRLVGRTGLLKLMPTLSTMESLAPRLRRPERLAERIPARGTRRAVVGMLTGCVQSAFFPDVNAATARVLAAEGCEVVIPRTQGCCGALSVHNGREAEAQKFARALIDTFEDVGMDYFVVNAAGCGSSLKEYDRLLADDPAYAERATAFTAKVRDLSEILVELGPVAPRHPLPVTVAYHDACHLGHAQGVRAQPRQLLRDIPELELREIADAEICCGSAGVWNILNPQPARQLGDRKARDVLATGAQLLVTANPGCLMQVAASVQRLNGTIGLAHTAQVLDASIRGLPVETLK
ncbi:4Fe-4S dicluster domain-containing protein [Planosporangium flavigriseum]|uniref:Glycolate oxidase iron-sulfur subunit n=1 Tax=Planosporangium flavigriseum TaxID=373681 RepID=A0A8J3PK77_9ACTN|nr:heterodisulfide reductase-related iron-sulfur binding cluster [Planosporangium flavigriseum]NJC64986.1 4Fe-4S dicluster domain-containing protein [Planosporangium flavigriseum]GIG71598.1 glycolate oxidase iron-sulfur subunit [Planosporangium flavigriseum]